MGIEVQSVKLLLLARAMGADFSDTLTIGRQDILADESQIVSAFARFGEALSPAEAKAMTGREDRFSSAIFDRLGAKRLQVMDISNYEGATVIHDLNAPLDPAIAEQFSVVFDGGTLEHVFDCPTALRSYMALPRIGGFLVIAVPANNEMGHGFYQFSPEFFFRTLTAENGYRLRGLFSVPMFADSDWLRVSDPASARLRVGDNVSRKPTYLFAIAERIAIAPVFVTAPQQSDYAAEWQEGDKTTEGHRPSPTARLKRTLLNVLPRRPVEILLQVRDMAAKPDPRLLTPYSPGRSPLL